MSTSIAIFTAASAQAAAASAMAAMAREDACKVTLATYKPEGATVEEMRDYADCVRLIHPRDMVGNELIAVKVCILIVFACAAYGAFRPPFMYGNPDIPDRAIGALMSAMIGAVAILVAVLVFFMGKVLFS